MGTELDTDIDAGTAMQITGRQSYTGLNVALARLCARLPWLDGGTAALLVGLVDDLAHAHPEVSAVLLFGSLARHDERPLDTSRPSDVDLLVLVRPTPGIPGARIPLEHKLAIYHTIGEREYRHSVPALGVQAVLATEALVDWDEQFVENVARDGVLLWARGPLPAALAPVADRGAAIAPPTCGA